MNKLQRERILHLCDVLESGKYEKGVGRLRDGSKYCCLGVACDISGVGEWKEDVGPVSVYTCGVTGAVNGIGFEDRDVYGLPIAVMQYYGLHSRGGLPIKGRFLPDYNDGYEGHDGEEVCLSHPEIAKVIRAWLEEQVVED